MSLITYLGDYIRHVSAYTNIFTILMFYTTSSAIHYSSTTLWCIFDNIVRLLTGSSSLKASFQSNFEGFIYDNKWTDILYISVTYFYIFLRIFNVTEIFFGWNSSLLNVLKARPTFCKFVARQKSISLYPNYFYNTN